MAERLRLYGLKALVTSAAGGIGEAVSRTLVKHGASVIAVDVPGSGVEQHFASVKGIVGLTANLGDATRMPALVEKVLELSVDLDIVICDFPLQPETPLADGDPALAELLETRAGLVMSRSAFSADGEQASAQAENDLAALTRALAGEIGEFGITANYIQPGAIMTPVSREVFRNDTTLRDFCIANSAAHRLGEPVDVAKVALFLASDDAGFVSGTGIAVDGGRAMR
jgi:NAD(P)-dependent dehydrogenase (short-subunit alcohol dehydrogenase family)